MAEAKRTVSNYIEDKVKGFVKFYDELLRNEGKDVTVAPKLRKHMKRCTHVFFFHSGVDSNHVESKMTEALFQKFGTRD